MTLYWITGTAIAFALAGVLYSLHERPTERARTYPLGSYERRTLEGGH